MVPEIFHFERFESSKKIETTHPSRSYLSHHFASPCDKCHVWKPLPLNFLTPRDEGMTRGSSILAYLVFGPGRTSTERMAKPTKMMAWRGPGARLDVQGKTRGDQVELGLD
jgi:hypothetical protein